METSRSQIPPVSPDGNLVKDSVFELLAVEGRRFTGKVMFRVFGM